MAVKGGVEFDREGSPRGGGRRVRIVERRAPGAGTVRRTGLPGLLLLGVLLWTGCRAPLERHEFSEPKMGTTFRIVLYARDGDTARVAADAAFERLDTLDAILSDYSPDSELSRACRAGAEGDPVRVGPELFDVLQRSLEWSERTSGAFDVTVAPCVRLWRRAFRRGELPEPERLEEARARVGYGALDLHPPDRMLLRLPDMRLDLGGIGKGFALDQAMHLLRLQGIEHALIDGGGDLLVSAPPPGEVGWKVAARSGHAREPDEHLLLSHVAVATSGDAEQFLEVGGVRYSHIVDPRTGYGVTGGRAATVIAPSGTDADALASALCVLEVGAGTALVESLAGVEARVVWEDGKGVLALESRGFGGFRAGGSVTLSPVPDETSAPRSLR